MVDLLLDRQLAQEDLALGVVIHDVRTVQGQPQHPGVLGVPFVEQFPALAVGNGGHIRSEEHTSELQSRENLVCRLLLEKKSTPTTTSTSFYPSTTSSAPP